MKRREFERTTPEAVGLRSEDIEWLLDELESGFTEMHGLMIMRCLLYTSPSPRDA